MTNAIIIPDSIAFPVMAVLAALLWLIVLQPLWRRWVVAARHAARRRKYVRNLLRNRP